MKVILQKNIKSLGKVGEIKEVKDGYASNYLIPNGLASLADENGIKAVRNKENIKEKKERREKKDLKKLANKLSGKTITLKFKADETGTLFAGLKQSKLVKVLNQRGYSLKANQLKLNENIKKVGEYKIELNVGLADKGFFNLLIEKE